MESQLKPIMGKCLKLILVLHLRSADAIKLHAQVPMSFKTVFH